MKITNVKDFRNKATTYLKSDEPTLVVRHGKVAGLLLPLQNTDNLSVDLRQELLEKLGDYLNKSLEAKNVPEEEILDDFKEFRKNRS